METGKHLADPAVGNLLPNLIHAVEVLPSWAVLLITVDLYFLLPITCHRSKLQQGGNPVQNRRLKYTLPGKQMLSEAYI